MSTAKHTPGPWIGAGPSFGGPLPLYTTEIITEWEDEDEGSPTICFLPFTHNDDENEANALLIAAAPELLEALQSCADILRHEGVWPGAEARARAAIAKATGETK